MGAGTPPSLVAPQRGKTGARQELLWRQTETQGRVEAARLLDCSIARLALPTDGSGEPVLAIGLVAILVTSGGAIASGSWCDTIAILNAILRVGEVAVFVGSGDGRARWRQRWRKRWRKRWRQ